MTTAERLNAMPLGEAMFTQRAIRRFKKDPIPDDVLEDIMQATIRAPNGGNTQQWRFIVVKDEEKRRKLGNCITRHGGPSGPTRESWGPRTCRRAGTACSRRGGWPTKSATLR